MILAGDIGGTKTILALFEQSRAGLRLDHDATFASGEYASFEMILQAFLKGVSVPPAAACFGVAGRVQNGRVRTTNLPWRLDERELARLLGAAHVKLLNDLEAAAYAMLVLPPEQFAELNAATPATVKSNLAVVAPGTGLGEAILYWDGHRYQPIASEGGHCDFAPRTDQEAELLKYLRGKVGLHVSYERILSGDGIRNIYSFLRDKEYAPEPAWLKEKLASGDANATIAQIALLGEHPLCVGALDLFCSILGAEAGNLALKCLATAGVILGGGIPPKILPLLQNGRFMEGFTDKGRFSQWMKEIPVRVALHPRAPLLGAAHYLFLTDTLPRT